MTSNFSHGTPRKLFLGPFRSLEETLAIELTAWKQRHGLLSPLWILTPTRLLALHLQRSLAKTIPQGHINLRFRTLNDLLLSDRLAPPLGLALLCQRLAANVLPPNSHFAPIRETAGFHAALLASFTDLKEAGVVPDVLRRAANTAKMRELSIAYAEFCAWLRQHDFVTEADLLWQPDIHTPSVPIFLYGFYDLNAAQRHFVQQLAPATVFFPAGNEYTEPLSRWFQALGYHAVSVPTPPSLVPTVVSCPGEVSEIREAIRETLRFVEITGSSFHEVAMLSRSREPYDAIQRDTLPSLGIPSFFRGGRPLVERPEAKRLLLLLDVIRSDYRRAEVMELACQLGPNSHWDARSVELGIVGGRAQWQSRVLQERSSPKKTELGEFISRLFAIAERIPQRARWAEIVEPVLAAFRALGGSHAGVEAAVQALADLDAFTSPVDFETFAVACRKTLESGREPSARFGDGIFVGDVMAARGVSWPLVIVLGMVEKSFPRVIREDPLLLDDERAAMSPDLPLKRRGYDEEPLLFRLTCAAARERLVLTYPRLEATTGKPRVPSVFLHSWINDDTRKIPMSALAAHMPALDEREFDLPVLAAGHDADRYLAAVSPLILAGVVAERNRWRKRILTGHDGCIESSAALRLLRERFGLEQLVISATSLEDFFNCPFFYFLKHVLHLESWKEPESAVMMDPADLGALYHSILEDFYKNGGDLPSVIERHLQRFEREGITGYPTVWEIKKEIVRQELAAFVVREQRRLAGQWIPSEFEKRFSGIIVAPPVRLRGAMDRLDRSADGGRARVLDYKTGKLPHGLKDDALAGGEALQLPLYLLAAEQLLPGVTIESAEYLYFTLRGGYRAIHFSRAALNARRAELTGLLETAATMIRDGWFAQYAQKDLCPRCEFRAVCGNGILRLCARKSEDEHMAEFRQIKESVA